jgi:hypothetical protein
MLVKKRAGHNSLPMVKGLLALGALPCGSLTPGDVTKKAKKKR